jgi:hypothetical protein
VNPPVGHFVTGLGATVKHFRFDSDSLNDFLLICLLDAVHACPTGVPSRPTPNVALH